MTHRAFVSVAVSATIAVVGLISVQLIAQRDLRESRRAHCVRRLEPRKAPHAGANHSAPDRREGRVAGAAHGMGPCRACRGLDERQRPRRAARAASRPGQRMFVTEEEYKERIAREEQTRQTAINASGAGTGGRDRALARRDNVSIDVPDGQSRKRAHAGRSHRSASHDARRAIAGASGKGRSTPSRTSRSTTAASHVASSAR